MYKPLVSILGDFYENRFLLIEALYVVNLPSVRRLFLRLKKFVIKIFEMGFSNDQTFFWSSFQNKTHKKDSMKMCLRKIK